MIKYLNYTIQPKENGFMYYRTCEGIDMDNVCYCRTVGECKEEIDSEIVDFLSKVVTAYSNISNSQEEDDGYASQIISYLKEIESREVDFDKQTYEVSEAYKAGYKVGKSEQPHWSKGLEYYLSGWQNCTEHWKKYIGEISVTDKKS